MNNVTLSKLASAMIRLAIDNELDITGFLSMEVIEMKKGKAYDKALVNRMKTMDRIHNELREKGIVIYVGRKDK